MKPPINKKARPNLRILSGDFSCSPPFNFLIDTGNVCNLKCPFCITGTNTKGRPKGFMKLEKYKLILEKVSPYAKSIGLYNWGEPFMHKDILKMVSLTAQKSIYTFLCSNLSFSDLDHYAIVNSGLNSLIVSIDGASQETYGKYRIGGNYDLVLKNIEGIQNAKKASKKNNPDIIWKFLINKFNEHEQATAKDMAQNLGVAIIFQLMATWNDKSWESSLHNTKCVIPETLTHSDPVKYNNRNRSLPVPIGRMILHPSVYEMCRQPFHTMTVSWDGSVYPCCSVYGEDAILGNLFNEKLEDLWNNAKYLTCRKFIYNYGPEQNTSSVCEMIKCSLTKKHISQ